MNTLELEGAVLECLDSLGGEGELQQVYKKLPAAMSLNASELRETEWGGRPYYQHAVRWCVSGLVKGGYLARTARGCYVLTQWGKARVDHVAHSS